MSHRKNPFFGIFFQGVLVNALKSNNPSLTVSMEVKYRLFLCLTLQMVSYNGITTSLYEQLQLYFYGSFFFQ